MSTAPETQPAVPSDTFTKLADLIYADPEPSAVHSAIANTAVDLIDGCDHASLMIAAGNRFLSIAASDQIAELIDTLEREAGEGPCVDAIVEEAYQVDSDIANGSQWPKLAQRVLAKTPVRGMIGYRLTVDNRKIGALNIFSDTPGALTEESAAQGAILASFASVALMTLSARNQAETLSRGLDSNREIGKAIGLLMAAHHFSEDEAFQLLRATSQNLNMKIAHVARQIIDGQQAQYPARER